MTAPSAPGPTWSVLARARVRIAVGMAAALGRLSAVLTASVTVGLVLLIGAGAAAPAAAAPAAGPTGWVRLGHLSPDTGAVDIYLSPYGKQSGTEILRKAGYGTLTPYRSLAQGFYTVAMRAAGAPASDPAMLSANVQIAAGKAYTVVALGRRTELKASVLNDDLTPPTAGKARVRLIQAATNASAVDVVAVGGPVIAKDVQYGTATGYAEVPQGRWTLQISAAMQGKTLATPTLDLRAGAVHSLLVVNTAGGSVDVRTMVDGSSMAAMPKGAVETGAGGTAVGVGGRDGTDPARTALLVALVLLPGLAVLRAGALRTGALRAGAVRVGRGPRHR